MLADGKGGAKRIDAHIHTYTRAHPHTHTHTQVGDARGNYGGSLLIYLLPSPFHTFLQSIQSPDLSLALNLTDSGDQYKQSSDGDGAGTLDLGKTDVLYWVI